MSYFHDASVEYQGRTVTLTAEECQPHESRACYWHGPNHPSSWLAVEIFWLAHKKLEGAPDDVVLELAAMALGVTVEELHGALRWNEEYIRWHDGDTDYYILQSSNNDKQDG